MISVTCKLVSCFFSSSWETIFCKSGEVVSPLELQCCRRLVQLCRDCLLVVYKFVSESRGSLTGLSPEWDDTRWEEPSSFLQSPYWELKTCFFNYFSCKITELPKIQEHTSRICQLLCSSCILSMFLLGWAKALQRVLSFSKWFKRYFKTTSYYLTIKPI